MTSARLAAPPDTVHLYWIPLVAPPGTPYSLLLPPSEATRAARFHLAEHRYRWLLSRIALRRILALHTGIGAAEIELIYSDHGKPSLHGGGLYFNLSHSEDVALLAICGQREVGVDIERYRELSDLADLARMVFSERERNEWACLKGAERIAAFYRIWTRKEAYIKGRGLGLAIPLDTFDVSLTTEPLPLLRAVRDGTSPRSEEWQIWSVAVPEPYQAALALAAPDPPHIERVTWSWS